jgi:hypothetical protein
VNILHAIFACREPSAEALAAAAAAGAGHGGNWRGAAHALYAGRGAAIGGEGDTAPGPGVVLYLLPMGAGQGKGGSTRGWGSPLHSFWCCHGSSVESFAKLADSVFFHRWGAALLAASCSHDHIMHCWQNCRTEP